MVKKIFLLVSILGFGVMLCTSVVQADTITWGFNGEFSGGTAPIGDPLIEPWLTATIEDVVGGVNLTMAATNLSGIENVVGWYFNLSDDFFSYEERLNPQGKVVGGTWVTTVGAPTQVSNLDIGTFTSPTFSIGMNAFKADGDGYYDILFAFAPGNSGDAFDQGDSVTFFFAGLAAEDFRELSTDSDGVGPFYSAAHVQNTGTDGSGSGWVAPVPEPATMLLLGFGMIGLAGLGRRKFFKM